MSRLSRHRLMKCDLPPVVDHSEALGGCLRPGAVGTGVGWPSIPNFVSGGFGQSSRGVGHIVVWGSLGGQLAVV